MKEIRYSDMTGLYGYIEESEEIAKKEKYSKEVKKALNIRSSYSFYYSTFEKCFKGSYKKQGKNYWFDLVPENKGKNGGTRLLLRVEDAFNNYTFRYFEEAM